MRKNLNDEFDEERTLDDLIPSYALNKSELDSYKKICDTENALIKSQMANLNVDSYSVGGYTAKYIVSQRVSMDEDKLLTVMKKHHISDVIKTREYVDMDALENYLYHLDEDDENTKAVLNDIDLCRDVKEVISLKISGERKKRNVRE